MTKRAWLPPSLALPLFDAGRSAARLAPLLLTFALLPTLPLRAAGPPQHFDLVATFVPPARAGGDGAIAVSFLPKDDAVHINEEPAPRLKLDPTQTVLVDRQAPRATSNPPDPGTAKYIDLRTPVRFAVAIAPGAPKGKQAVKAAVSYFYCSKREGWCRKGTTDIDVAVVVP